MKTKKGYSLIEVMISTVVLGTLAIGGAASLKYAGTSIQIQQQNRAALAVATSVLEEHVHGRGVATLKSIAEEENGWETKKTVIFNDGAKFDVEREIVYNGNVELRVKVTGVSSDSVTLCYIATPGS